LVTLACSAGLQPSAFIPLRALCVSVPSALILFFGSWFSIFNQQLKTKNLQLGSFKLCRPASRAILGALDIPVDIGAPAEKEVIQ